RQKPGPREALKNAQAEGCAPDATAGQAQRPALLPVQQPQRLRQPGGIADWAGPDLPYRGIGTVQPLIFVEQHPRQIDDAAVRFCGAAALTHLAHGRGPGTGVDQIIAGTRVAPSRAPADRPEVDP